jgi:hypothetical protein
MSDAYVIAVDGLSALRDLETIPQSIKVAALRAVNKTLDRTATRARRRVADQVNFSAGYLTGADSSGKQRLGVARRATQETLEGEIVGRGRPTSLARFITSSSKRNGVTLQVGTGLARRSRRIFPVRLRAGTADIETKSNLGLAIRLKPGERVENKTKMVQLRGNLYLLYGPAVAQVFASVADEEAPEAGEFLEAEFFRLMGLN